MAIAVPDLVVSAAEVAVMVTFDGVGIVAGAVYSPEALIVPTVVFPPCAPLALQVTAVLLAPVTVAVYCWVPLGATSAVRGETETAIVDAVPGLAEPGVVGLLGLLEPTPRPPHEMAKNAVRTSKSALSVDHCLFVFIERLTPERVGTKWGRVYRENG